MTSNQQLRNQLFEEFDFKTKAGTAWSHNYLNQKPWHPLSYPNQRRKWIAEQMHGISDKRKKEVEKEFQKEQEFIRQSALLSKKEKEKAEALQAVSFMYSKPPGYNAESARAAELADEERRQKLLGNAFDATVSQEGRGEGERESEVGRGESGGGEGSDGRELATKNVEEEEKGEGAEEEEKEDEEEKRQKKKKKRATDVFGRAVATGDDFEILKNAPKMDTGIVGRPRPFGVEIRMVRCGRCGELGHQSGERECALKDSITKLEEERQKREDPLSLILAHNRHEPFAWEPKQALGGISPPRGGFKADDENQQILPPDEDEVFDQYGGFLGGGVGLEFGKDDFDEPCAIPEGVLGGLSKKQRRELEKAYRKKRRREKGGGERGVPKEKKRKKREERIKRRQKRKDNSSSGGESTSEEGGSSAEEKSRRKRQKNKNKPSSEDDSSMGSKERKRKNHSRQRKYHGDRGDEKLNRGKK